MPSPVQKDPKSSTQEGSSSPAVETATTQAPIIDGSTSTSQAAQAQKATAPHSRETAKEGVDEASSHDTATGAVEVIEDLAMTPSVEELIQLGKDDTEVNSPKTVPVTTARNGISTGDAAGASIGTSSLNVTGGKAGEDTSSNEALAGSSASLPQNRASNSVQTTTNTPKDSTPAVATAAKSTNANPKSTPNNNQRFLCYAIRHGRTFSHGILLHKADVQKQVCPHLEYKMCQSIQEAISYLLTDEQLASTWALKSVTPVQMPPEGNKAGRKKRPIVVDLTTQTTKGVKKVKPDKNVYMNSWSSKKLPPSLSTPNLNVWNKNVLSSTETNSSSIASSTTSSSLWRAKPIPSKLAPTGIIANSNVWSGGSKAAMAIHSNTDAVPPKAVGNVSGAVISSSTNNGTTSCETKEPTNGGDMNSSTANAIPTPSNQTLPSKTSAMSTNMDSESASSQVAQMTTNSNTQLVEYWDRMYGQLVHYKNKRKTFDDLTPRRAGPLGAWAYRQRRFYQQAKDEDLAPDKKIKKAKLLQIGFTFEQKKLPTKKFANQLSKDGSGPTDPKVHMADLEANGIVMASWSSIGALKGKVPTKYSETRWNEMFNELVKYKEENDGFSTMTNNSSKLGKWANDQRQAFKQFKAGYPLALPLTQERLQKLIEIGFDLVREPRLNRVQMFEKNFEKMFEQLKLVKDATGSCVVRRQGYVDTCLKLGFFFFFSV